MSEVAELRAARSRIRNPREWWRGPGALDGSASFHCAVTALGGSWAEDEAIARLDDAAEEIFGSLGPQALPGELAALVNDEFGHPYVMAMYDRAIELAEAP